jgi:hypothetical protein
MAKFRVTIRRRWSEFGTVEIEAADADDAREVGLEAASRDDDDIEWREMDPENDEIESVEEV